MHRRGTWLWLCVGAAHEAWPVSLGTLGSHEESVRVWDLNPKP